MTTSGAGPQLLTQPPARLIAGAGVLLPLLGRACGARAIAIRAGDGPWTAAEACGVGDEDAFWALLPIVAGPSSRDLSVIARVTMRDGEHESELARIVVDGVDPAAGAPAESPSDAAIAVCLPTHEPDPELLQRQIESLRAQTLGDWVCLVADDGSSPAGLAVVREAIGSDARFVLREFAGRAGVYRHVERALGALPAGPGLVALCDQDDRWAPDKLERLVATLAADPGALLAHGDQRIVDREGRVLATSSWTDRSRSEDRLRDLVTANTVTGAASLLRRSVLSDALPFPPPIGPDAFHDHWLALVAAATGRVAFTDAIVGDYVQHEGNVLGHRPLRGPRSPAPRRERWQASYVDVLLWRQALAGTLLLRFADRLDDRDRRELARTAAGARAPLTLAGRALAGATRPRRTLGHEWRALRGALWLVQARRASTPIDPDGPFRGLGER